MLSSPTDPILPRALSMLRTRRRLPFWGMLLIWLVMSIGFTIYNWFLVRQDEAIAPREKVVLGSIYRTAHGKQDKAFYSFTYAGREYRGNEIVRPDQMNMGAVSVYFDPRHPSTNTLVEYRHKSEQDRWLMRGCGYASIGFAAALAGIWGFKAAQMKAKQEAPIAVSGAKAQRN